MLGSWALFLLIWDVIIMVLGSLVAQYSLAMSCTVMGAEVRRLSFTDSYSSSSSADTSIPAHRKLDQHSKVDVIIRVIIIHSGGGRCRDDKTTVAETVRDVGCGYLVPGSLDSIAHIKNCPVEVPASLHSLQQSMLCTKKWR